jgi:hypothetical protein
MSTDIYGREDRPAPSAGPAVGGADEVYDYFLSYHSDDRPAVVVVRTRLEERGVTSFFDQASVVPGRPWFEPLQAGVARSRADRSRAMARVAKSQARLGLFLKARESAAHCSSSADRHSAFTAILREYYKRRGAIWRASIEALEAAESFGKP